MTQAKAAVFEQLQHSLIVSCQAEEGFPLNKPEHLTAIAQTAVIGGASAIRASIPVNIRAMKQVLQVPIIGIYKKDYPGFDVRITPTLVEVEAIVQAGSDIIALDATFRPRPDGKGFADLFQNIRDRFDVPIGMKTRVRGIDRQFIQGDLGNGLHEFHWITRFRICVSHPRE